MIVSKKRVAELEEHIERLEQNKQVLTQQRYALLAQTETMGHELKQLRKEQHQVVSTEDADLLNQELNQARSTIDELQLALHHQNEQHAATITALKSELEAVTRHRDNAKHAFRRVSAKRSKSSEQNS